MCCDHLQPNNKWLIERKKLRNIFPHIVVLFKQLNNDIKKVQPIIVCLYLYFLSETGETHETDDEIDEVDESG